MMITKAVLCTCLIIVLVAYTNALFKGPIRVCGDHLGNILQLVCRSNYNRKRTIESNGLNDWPFDFSANDRNDYSFYNSIQGYHPKMNKELSLRGIVDECCLKSCTFETLTQYCASD